MALKSSIHKVELQIADMDRHYYASHLLTIARHPSETSERLLYRIAVFALHASDSLSFTKGIGSDDEPDLWRKNLSDEIELWIDLGQPDEKRIRKARGRARQVLIYGYAPRAAAIWWRQNSARLRRFEHLGVHLLHCDDDIAVLARRNMRLLANIQDGVLSLGDADNGVDIRVEHLKTRQHLPDDPSR